jgi:putative drug exporter of the RND superfamily
VLAAVAEVPGVAAKPGSVCVAPDFAKIAQVAPGDVPNLTAGCAPPALQAHPVDGRILIDANLTDRYDTAQATATLKNIRAAVHAIPGADALVGGATAINYDTQQASRHDRNLIIPIVLLVILLVLGLVLRAILARCS